MSGLLTGMSFIAGVGAGVALADSPYPRPGSEPAELSRYFTENSRSARLSGIGQLVSSVSLGRFTVSVARLAGLRTGELDRPVAITGLISTASGLLSPLYFVKEQAGWFIPLGRFSGLVVSGIAGVRLGRPR